MLQPKHTWLLHDCRPMKAAAHKALDDFMARRIDVIELRDTLYALASGLPDLTPAKFAGQVTLTAIHPDRAHGLVNALGDHTLRPWVRRVWALSRFCAKLGALAAFVWLIVWLAT